MKIALLVCDDSNNTFPHNSGSYVEMFVQFFEEIDRQVELIPFDVRFKKYPDDLSIYDGFLTTGSSHSVHQDQIVELPPKAEVIGHYQGCRYAMIKIGEHFIGFQGHPEFRKEYALPLMESRRDRIALEIIDSAKLSFEISPDHKMLCTWMYNFFSRELSMQ